MERYWGGITLGTDSYFPPEVEFRLVRLVPNRDYVSPTPDVYKLWIPYSLYNTDTFELYRMKAKPYICNLTVPIPEVVNLTKRIKFA